HANGPRPVLALNAAPGEVDVVIASELLEATRAIQAGFVTPDRTILIASTARVFTVDEKAAMGDGRLDEARMLALARRFARRAIVDDFTAVAAGSASPLNAVLLGAIAAARALPIDVDAFRGAIRAEAKSVEANLRGFEAGLAGAATPSTRAAAVAANPASAPDTPGEIDIPSEARAVVAEGVRRLTDYQDATYAQRYMTRVARFIGRPGADGPLVRELARHLAVRMSVEDVIRVAQLKLREARLARVRHEARAAQGDIVDITEFMKPGPEEMAGLLPPALGRWVLRRVAARGWGDKALRLKIRTTRASGFLRLKLLAGMRRWRPRTLRFAQENAWVERWLDLVERTLALDPAAAREVIATASLVRGYADTYRRGLSNWTSIVTEVIEPMLAGTLPRQHFADAVLQARLAASKDPEGETLRQTLDAIARAAPAKIAAE
ncbi:MAG TPA: indolepyruvate oxidoreductase subunit beta family protein, partial [Hyphomicrobiaceae bacterium]|nr:indolepyruvate oxidoreductase subunit beta family protein [Hyphomicrobiaceae bacterium]